MNESKNNYYYILTAEVDNDERLSDFEKLMFARITGLTHELGYCYASNKYFEDKYKVSKAKVDRAIRKLKDCGYIYTKLIYKNNSKEIDKRLIFLADVVNREVVKVYSPANIGIITSDYTPIIADDTDNNEINNTINLIIEKIYKKDKNAANNIRKNNNSKNHIRDRDFMDYSDKSNIATLSDVNLDETF